MSIISAELISLYPDSQITSQVDVNLNDGLVTVITFDGKHEESATLIKEFLLYEEEEFLVSIVANGDMYVSSLDIDDLRALAMG